jgi:LPXTG-site transpeptidase (sortase) family protein
MFARNTRNRSVYYWAFWAFVYLLVVAAVLAVTNLPAFYKETKYIVSSKSSQPKVTVTSGFQVIIPKIGVDAPVVLSDKRHWPEIQGELTQGVVHYFGTALPGDMGNVGLTGHSSNYVWAPGKYNYVFTLLDHLQNGDMVYVDYHSKRYKYRVVGKKVVSPSQSEVLNQTADRRLTLITCWPIFTDWQRLVVVAKQL